MAITTIDGAAAGMSLPKEIVKVGVTMTTGVPYSTFYIGPTPAAGSAPASGLAGAALTSVAGQIPFTNPASGNTYLGRVQMGCSPSTGVFTLCDRLWQNSGITITSTDAQTVNSAAWPARDAGGSTDGEGVYIGVEVSGATGAATPTITLGYTNSAGTAGRTGTNINPTISSSGVGHFYPIGLQAGDTGVRSVQSITLSASWISGTIHLVAFRVLARLESPVANTNRTVAIDWVTGGAARLYNNTVPWLLFTPGNSTLTTFLGNVTFTQG